MAGLDTIFSLTDRLSRPLQTIENNLNRTQRVATATGTAIDGMGSGIGGATARQAQFNSELAEGRREASGLETSIKGFVAAYVGFQTLAQGVSAFVRMSDELTSAEARLSGIVDETQTLEQLSQKVYESAQRSRGAYASTAQFIARVGQMASDLFTNDELVKFAETINKQMVINGTTTWEAEAAMTQLSQALGSGVLRGEELNSVFEQAPGIIKMISEYLDVDIGQIRDMAAEGQLTAEVVKNAVLSSAAEIDAQFESMPMTWAQTWQNFTNQVAWNLKPLSQAWSEFLNTAMVQNFFTALASLIGLFGRLLTAVINFINAALQMEQVQFVLKIIGTTVGVLLVLAFLRLAVAGAAAFASIVRTAVVAAAAFVAAHAPLIAMITIFALIVQGAEDMGMSVRDVFMVLGGGITGIVFSIDSLFTTLWDNLKAGANNAVSYILGKFAEMINWLADKVNNNGIAKKLGISMDTVSYTPSYQSINSLSDNMSAAYERGYAYGSYYVNKGFNWAGSKIDSLKSLASQATSVSGGSNLNIGEIPTAEEIGFGTLDDIDGSTDDTAKATEETAKNTGNISKTLKAAALDIAMLKALARTQEMKKIEQNLQLNIDAPINGTTQADLDGFVDELTGAVQVALQNTMTNYNPPGGVSYG